jgi:tripartite-type tricarboxylate transporter receptor subunit TctC
MPISRRRQLTLMAALACAMLAPPAGADGYPSMPIRLVVPFPPGGPSDDIARILADSLNATGTMRIVVENRPGAGGTVAVAGVAKASPDGYTVLFTSLGPLAISPHLRSDVGYDPLKDFAPVAHLASLVPVYAVHPSVPARNAKELADLARAKPGSVTLGTSGNGSTVHISVELFKAAAKADIVHVPYKGAAPALTDALGGQITGVVVDVPGVISHLRAGKLRAVAVAGPARSALLPDVPTMAELGFTEVDATNWVGVLLPVKTPAAVRLQFTAAVRAAVDSQMFRERVTRAGAIPSTLRTPEEFGQYIAAEHQRWGRRIARFGIRSE